MERVLTSLPWAWAGLVAAGVAAHRPRPVRRLPGAHEHIAAPALLARLGRRARSAARRPADPDADRRVGAALVACAVLVPLVPALVPVVVLAALAAPVVARARARRVEARAWAEALPDAVDLLSVALGGGLVVPQAIELVGGVAGAPVGPVLARAAARVAHGAALPDALERAAAEAPAVRPLTTVLVAAHLDGGGVGDALAGLAGELRVRWQRDAEARARQVPVQMLFPLVGCTLPAFVLVTVVPSILSALDALEI